MTLKVRVIPCLDVKDGRVVKGVKFVDLVDAGDPVEAAAAYDAAGADELCFLDITASSDNRETIFDLQKWAYLSLFTIPVGEVLLAIWLLLLLAYLLIRFIRRSRAPQGDA